MWKSRVVFSAFSLQTQVSSSPVANLRLPRLFACTTTLECHSPRPLNNPACSLTSPPPAFATAPISLPHSTITKPTGLDIASYLPYPPLPQWHLLLSLQQLQAVTLAPHAQILAASGECILLSILLHAATRRIPVYSSTSPSKIILVHSHAPTVTHHSSRCFHGLRCAWSAAY